MKLHDAVEAHFKDSIPEDDDHSLDVLAWIVERFDLRTDPLVVVDWIRQQRRKRAESLGVTDAAFRAWQREHGFRIVDDDQCLYEYLRKKHRVTKKTKEWMKSFYEFEEYKFNELEKTGSPYYMQS